MLTQRLVEREGQEVLLAIWLEVVIANLLGDVTTHQLLTRFGRMEAVTQVAMTFAILELLGDATF